MNGRTYNVVVGVFTTLGFLIAVAMAVLELQRSFGKDPNVQGLLERFQTSFSTFGAWYSYFVWVVFLTVYITILRYETVRGITKKERELVARNYFLTLWVWGTVAMLVQHVTHMTQSVLSIPLLDNAPFLIVALALVTGAWGMFLLVEGRIHIDGYWTNHIYKYQKQEIVMSGVYAKTRHPIYSGQIFLMISIFVANNNLWVGPEVLLIVVYNVMRARREEKYLDTLFHGEYEKYKETTPSFMCYPFA
ncbi:MAG: isoprenylcysteine carboxylmethyltransferase family protein [Planctomycetota bacterium]|nr:isoprenylcysteine carboxylmethyltransferase family protein [Planctomycetota bacterium]